MPSNCLIDSKKCDAGTDPESKRASPVFASHSLLNNNKDVHLLMSLLLDAIVTNKYQDLSSFPANDVSNLVKDVKNHGKNFVKS